MNRGYRLGVDTGGTFTDLCLFDESTGRFQVSKVPSTPSNPALAVMAGINKWLQDKTILPEALRFFIHGTTVATNALLEHKGARTALLTTAGFEDVLHIGRQNRPQIYRFRSRRPPPIVPRHLRYGMMERMLCTGEVLQSLDVAAAAGIIREIKAQGVKSIAVSLLHSYANPVHEQTLAQLIAEIFPEAYVTVSSEVLPEFREYERTSTICINAFVMPGVNDYVAELEQNLKSLGIASDLYIMQSNGGVITARTACRVSARTVLSGPAGGALTGAALSKTTCRPNVITLDMGGTSTDICLIESGRPQLTAQSDIGGHPIRLPMIDINTIGAGGGSIARLDPGGALRVGPESAGADPGPVCYGRGGSEPTVTDANVILGRINPTQLLGGEMPLYLDKAKQVLEERIARPLGMNLFQAAAGIIDVVNANMIRGIRRVSVEQGYDPRDFVLVPFGGAGPVHGVALARALNINEIMVPAYPGIASALGMLSADVRHDYVQSHVARSEGADVGQVLSIYENMEEQGRVQLRREGFSDEAMVFIRSADMRYLRQAYELSVPVKAGPLLQKDLDDMVARFHECHDDAYGYARWDEPVELVNLRVAAIGNLPEFDHAAQAVSRHLAAEPICHRSVFFDGALLKADVYERQQFFPGACIVGPAIIEQGDATTVILPGYKGEIDAFLNLMITPQGD